MGDIGAGLTFSFFEVQDGKFFMILPCCIIVSLGGFDFVVERADGFAFAIMGYLDIPFLCSLLPAHSFIF